MELLNCPFCRAGGTSVHMVEFPLPDGKAKYHVACDMTIKGCGASSGWFDTPEEAAEAWNGRAE